VSGLYAVYITYDVLY